MAWDRIRGHDAAASSFRAAFEHARLGQAFLLVGPEGVGKMLFARELAKALLCEQPTTPLTACDRCRACLQVEAGTHPDVFTARTPEGKHELPIAAIREFCAHMAMKPARGRRKVGIVVDADQFNEESANAFLKTLEEPPPGSLLLLLATGTDWMLPTILSRCQVVRFAPLGAAELRAVLADYGIVDAAQQDRLIRLASGSPGRALALTDEEVWAIRQRLIDGLTGSKPDFAALAEMWEKYFKDVPKDNTAAQRERVSLMIRFLLETLRDALRLAVGAETTALDPTEAARLKAFAERLGADRIAGLIDRCAEADYHVERRVQLILVVELVLEQFTRPALAGV